MYNKYKALVVFASLVLLLGISTVQSQRNYTRNIRAWGPTEPAERAAELGELPETMPSLRTIKAYINYHAPKASDVYTDYKRIIPESLAKRLGKWECENLAEYVLNFDARALAFDPWLRGCLNTGMLLSVVDGKYFYHRQLGEVLELFDRSLWTPEVVILCSRSSRCAWDMPNGLFTNAELLRAAIEQNTLTNMPVDEGSWTSELVEEALRRNVRNYEYVPEKFKTFEAALRVVREDGLLLRLVPREQRLMKKGLLCREALLNDDRAEEHVPAIFKYRFGS